jgi:hypothetical protein
MKGSLRNQAMFAANRASRAGIFLAVLLAHAAALILLMTPAMLRLGAELGPPLTLLSLPAQVRLETPGRTAALERIHVEVVPPALSLEGPPPAAESAVTDFDLEMRRQAGAISAPGDQYRGFGHVPTEYVALPAPRAAHHAGEQYLNDAGIWIVWISPFCYQMAGTATLPDSVQSPVGQRVMPPSYCIGPSGAIDALPLQAVSANATFERP